MVWILASIVLIIILKKPKLKKFFAWLALCLIVSFGNSFLFTIVGSKWEIPSRPATTITGHYKYAVVLGGMGSINKQTGKLHVSQSIDRVLQAIILYKQGKVEKIVITGGSGAVFGQDKREAPMIKNFCIDMGVKAEDIVSEPNSRNTHENAVFTKELIGAGTDKIILITSAVHMRRSIGCFKKEGYVFYYLSTDPLIQSNIYFEDIVVPKAEVLYNWNSLIKEMVGMAVYKIVGYI